MKAAAFTAALMMLSGSAIAQTYNDPATTDSTSMTAPSSTWSNSATNSMTMATNTAPAGGQMVAPDNSNPERDARGIAVISAPAVVPAGYNGTASGMTGMGGPELDASGNAVTDNASAQPCTRTVTDHCVQTSARGRRRYARA